MNAPRSAVGIYWQSVIAACDDARKRREVGELEQLRGHLQWLETFVFKFQHAEVHAVRIELGRDLMALKNPARQERVARRDGEKI